MLGRSDRGRGPVAGAQLLHIDLWREVGWAPDSPPPAGARALAPGRRGIYEHLWKEARDAR